TRHTAGVLESADLIVGFGASLTTWTTRHDTILTEGTVLAQVDTDRSALGLNPRVQLGVVGDVEATASLLLTAVAAEGRTPASQWLSAPPVAPPLERHAHVPSALANTVHPAWFTDALEEMLPAERTVVIEGGHFIGWQATRTSVPVPHGFLFLIAV